MYYDPFRRKWVWSQRCYWNGRSRRYADSDAFAVSKPGYSSGASERWTEIPSGNLYSFWISPSVRGESRGYVAAGGPAYKGLKDL